MDRSATLFPVLETARIFVPGMYFLFAAVLLITGFEIPVGPFSPWYISLTVILAGSAIVGLSLYAKETPKQRKAFRNNQPSRYLLERSRVLFPAAPLTEEEARRLYFYLLNHHVPPIVQEKIFFFGTIYHIIVYIRRLSFWFGMLGSAGLILLLALHGRMPAAAVAAVSVLWLIYGLNVRFNKADRKMQENYEDQIFWLEMNRTTVDALITQRRQSS